LTLDPNFATNGYIYAAYTRPDGDFNRVSRITASPDNHHVMQAGSEKILIDDIPSPTGIHQMGEMQIGKDGKLYVPSGDGSIDSQTSSQLDTLSGKMLRINLDGSVPTDNPFYGQADKRPEIWAYGLRNPFSSGMQQSTGRIFVNEVGRDTWEEINELQKGANYGFPECEGKCQPARAGFTDPFYQYSHYEGDVVGRSITAGAWYEGDIYPADFKGDYVFADYVAGWIKRIDPVTKEVKDVAEGFSGVVNLKQGPDGLIYVVQLDVNTGSGTIKKLNYGQPTAPPTANQLLVYAAGTPAAGVYPTMEVLIDDKVVSTQANVQGNPFSRQFVEYAYQLPSNVTADQVKINFPNDFMANGEDRNLYVDRIVLNGITIQSEDPQVLSTGAWTADTGCNPGNKRSETLSCGGYFQYGQSANQKPTASMTTPTAETHYDAGTTINFSGTGSDLEDGNLPAGKLSWNIVFLHDTHSHPFLTFNGTDKGSFTIPDVGETAADTFYRLILTTTDSAGQTTTATRDIFPNIVKLGLSTNIPGLSLTLDGGPRPAPLSINAVVGFKRTITAPITQTYEGKTYEFVGWSDSGAASHTITTPKTDTTYQAAYRLKDGTTPPSTTTIKIYAAGSPAQGIYPTMELQIDGRVVATHTDIRGNFSNRQFTEYTYTSDQTISPGSIRLNYPNDAFINGEDRNLYVDKITINGAVYETEDQSTLSTGTWTADTGCSPGNKRSETLSCGGYFQYGGATVTPPPQEGSRLSIYAAGSSAQNVFPTMNLVVNGQLVKTHTDVRGNYGSRQFVKYDYVSNIELNASQIQLDFINDAFINGEDRNLYVDKIVLDGVTYEAEAPSTRSLGSWNSATGCAEGFKASEALSCNGYFKFQQ
ncbi:MAG TPA: carbohydrate-binding domain-containing protein, partial [Candidatus Nitrosotenuis sp.]|nr:carbohydrate-binding domain-containing protein [Candidatus Nitrosotenuis sp.]